MAHRLSASTLPWFGILSIVALLITGSAIQFSAPAQAANKNYVVTTTNWTEDATPGNGICADGVGACSLRAAIQEANADGDTTAITFDAALNGSTITYNADISLITAPVTITGPGAANLTLDCGTAPNESIFVFDVGGEGTIISGGFTVTGCTDSTKGINGIQSDTTISDVVMGGGGSIVTACCSLEMDNLTISNNTLTGGSSIAVGTDTVPLTNSTISGNSITAPSLGGITGYIGTGNTIDDNTIANNVSGNAIELSVNASGNSITNNTITNSNQNGIDIDTGPLTSLTITGNSITTTNNDGNGIMVSANTFTVTNVNISNNTVTTTDGIGRGIQVYSFDDNSSFTISNNTVTSASSSGIQVNGDGSVSGVTATINGNTVKDGASYGIIVNGLVSPTITMNTNTVGAAAEHNANIGILFTTISGGTLTMNGNTVRYNDNGGIYFGKSAAETGFTTATLTNNTSSNNTNSGLEITLGGSYTIGTSGNGNTFSSNTTYGINLNSPGEAVPTIAYNTISSNTLSGIYVQAVDDGGSISNNTISNNTQNGILLAATTGVEVSDNTISNNDSAAGGVFSASWFLYTYDGNEYDNDGDNDYIIEPDGTFTSLDSVTANDQALTVPDGTNDFNLYMAEVGGTYVTIFFDATNIDSEAAADTACDTLMDSCTTSVWLEDVFTANGDADYDYDQDAVTSAGVTVSTGGSPQWAFNNEHSYYGIKVTGSGENTFSGNTISGNGNGMYFGSSAVAQTVSDSTISDSITLDVETKLEDVISLDNSTFTTYDVCNGCTIDVNFDARVRTLNASAAAIEGATATATDTDDGDTSLGSTDGSGYTSYTSLDAYQIDNTGIINVKNPYTFTAAAGGYLSDTSDSTTLSAPNTTVTITLASAGSSPRREDSGGGGGGSSSMSTTPTPTTPTEPTTPSTLPGDLKVGDLVKLATSPAVYQIGTDHKRHVFIDAPTYFSWYPDFTTVQTIDPSILVQFPLGTPMTYAPGTLLKVPSLPRVYLVEAPNVLRWIVSESVFHALGYSFSQVKDLAESLFSFYVEGPVVE